jgi:hypothetical protein
MSSPFRVASVGLVALALSGLVYAQAPTPPKATTASRPAAQPQAAADRLPVRRVVLYKSGVGYFEHLGRIRGNQTVTIDFTSGQLNDVLKSLTALDLDGGRVLGVRYNSEAGLDRRLSALRLPLGADTTRAEFFSALRGARLEVRAGATRLVGRLLSVEQIERKTDAGVVRVDTLSIVTDAGEIQTFALDTGVSVRLMEADLTQEVGRYLSLIASARDQDLRRVSIATSGTGDRDLFISYISEVPIWKPTYRIVLPAAGAARKPILQGWAIIDNTVGEDWSNVELSLVAGAPQSFVQAISRPYYVQRPVVPLPQFVSFAPQTHQGALNTAGAGALAGTITDVSGGVLPGVTVRVMQGPSVVTTVTTNAAGRYNVSGLSPGTYTVQAALSGFNTTSLKEVQVSGGMETVLNATMQIGRVSQELTVMASASVVDTKRTTTGTTYKSFDSFEGVSITAAAQQSDATGGQLGDLFEYKLKTPVTIPKNQSALVPILSGEVEAEKVSLWSPTTRGGRPLRAVWLTNGTGSTLDGGSFSVMDADAFAGEGLLEPLKAGEKRLLSYAVDLAVQVDAKGESMPTRFTRVRIARGVVTQESEERQRRVYTVRNEDTEARTLVLDHPARAGWTIGGTIAPSETTPAWHRFRVPIAAKTTATFTVDEVRPGQAQYSVLSVTDDQLAVLVKEELISAETEAALQRIFAQKAEVARLVGEIGAREAAIVAIDRDQARVRENLKALKGSAEERHLVQRYVKQLDEQENRLIALRKEQQALDAERHKAQTELERLIEALAT